MMAIAGGVESFYPDAKPEPLSVLVNSGFVVGMPSHHMRLCLSLIQDSARCIATSSGFPVR